MNIKKFLKELNIEEDLEIMKIKNKIQSLIQEKTNIKNIYISTDNLELKQIYKDRITLLTKQTNTLYKRICIYRENPSFIEKYIDLQTINDYSQAIDRTIDEINEYNLKITQTNNEALVKLYKKMIKSKNILIESYKKSIKCLENN